MSDGDPAGGPYYCGYEDTGSGAPCGIQVSNPSETCGLHPNRPGGQPGNDNAVANDGGAPIGNDNAKGHGAPEGNANAVDHGMFGAIEKKLDILIDEYGPWAGQYLKEREQEYREKCANPSRAHRLAVKQTLAEVMDERVLRGGSPAVIEAQNALEREVRMGLAYEGVREKVSTSDSSSHDNLHLLVDGGDSD